MTKFQKTCLSLAKHSILNRLGVWRIYDIEHKDPKFNQKRACFISLKKNNDLRGCIGSLMPYRRLYDDIINNACNAAFEDSRFNQLNLQEIEKNDIELSITILSPIEDKNFKDKKELLAFLQKERCWLIIRLEYRQATFLPCVRDDISDARDFVKHLLDKAMISVDEFDRYFNDFQFQIYTWDKFGAKRIDIE